jgi:hypothetical protein
LAGLLLFKRQHEELKIGEMKKERAYPVIFIFLLAISSLACKKPSTVRVPAVSTGAATEITQTGAKVDGNVTSAGGADVTERGICWATSANPTVSNFKLAAASGTGQFSVIITGLSANVNYHVRAYAINSAGTAYGENITFKTSQAANATAGFNVCGPKIYDPTGKEFIVKGINIGGPGSSWPDNTLNQFDNVVNKWKFNAIRLGTKGGPQIDNQTTFNCSGTNFPQYQYTTFGTIREIVKKYTDAKVVVIIEWHKVGSIFTGSDLSCATKWWVDVAEAFKDNPYVWFDLYNEPQTASHDTWASSMQTVINAVRATGNTNIIVATGNYWGQDSNNWSCTNIPEGNSAILSKTLEDQTGNLVYAIHVYDQWDQCQSKLDDFVNRVQAKGKCLLIGEYGVHNNRDLSNALTYALSAAQSKKLGRIAWAWYGGDDNKLTTSGNGGGPQAAYGPNGVPSNLSAFGQAVWADLNRTETLSDKPVCN